MNDVSFKSGFIAIIGRPNAGKSTLLNRIVGLKVSIVTPKPQTTRNTIRGIANFENAQLVFLDTPGIFSGKGQKKLEKSLKQSAFRALEGVDIILFIVDLREREPNAERSICHKLKALEVPVMLLLNKVDLIPKHELLPIIDEMQQIIDFKEIFPISALHGDNVEELVDSIIDTIPEGPQYFSPELSTDQPEELFLAEIVREKVIYHLYRELPYSCAVVVDDTFMDEERELYSISARIIVERDSQKGIVIGKKGSMLKRIGTLAREAMEQVLGVQVFLSLKVSVEKDWRNNPKFLRRLGYVDD